jgi:hypothetical protein
MAPGVAGTSRAVALSRAARRVGPCFALERCWRGHTVSWSGNLGAGATIASAPRRSVSARAPTAFRRSRVRQTGTIRWRKEHLPHDRRVGQTLSHQSRGMLYAERRRRDRPDWPCDGYATAAWPDQRHTTPVAARRALCVVTAGRGRGTPLRPSRGPHRRDRGRSATSDRRPPGPARRPRARLPQGQASRTRRARSALPAR